MDDFFPFSKATENVVVAEQKQCGIIYKTDRYHQICSFMPQSSADLSGHSPRNSEGDLW